MHARERVACQRSRSHSNHREPRASALAAALLLMAACNAAGSSPAVAGTIYWNMQTLAPTSMFDATGLVAGDLTRDQAGNTSVLDSLQPSAGYQFLLDASSTAASGGNNAQAATLGGPLISGSSAFFSVTLTNTSAGSFRITGVGFGSRSTSTGPQRYSVRSSLDGFLATIPGATGTMSANSVWVYHTASFASSIALAAGQSLALRLYGSDGTADQRNAGNWRIDDLQVTFVPEPATVGLLACTLVAGVMVGLLRMRSGPVNRPSRT